jgi:hypothetical protein
MINRDQYKKQMIEDFPLVPEYLIDWCLDILETDDGLEFFKKLQKGGKRGRKSKQDKQDANENLKTFELKCCEIIKNNKGKSDAEEIKLPSINYLTDNGLILTSYE